MKINHNMSATITNAQLLRTENSLSDSMERLSSGLKINHAKDDPSGMAISKKLGAQIDGLDMASQNAQNGQSLLEIADGALGETTAIIQRMRELAVQAASDTSTSSDRQAIQSEINQLLEEVNRISRDTEYNTKTLLDGSSDVRTYSEGAKNIYTSDTVDPGLYKMTILSLSEPAEYSASNTAVSTNISATEAGTISINGVEATIAEGDTPEEVYEKLRNAAELAGVTMSDRGHTSSSFNGLIFTTDDTGGDVSLTISVDNDDLASKLGITGLTDGTLTTTGTTGTVRLDYPSTEYTNWKTSTVSVDGYDIKVTDRDGFEISYTLSDKTIDDFYNTGSAEVVLDVTDIGTMTLQIGANEHQTIDVRIPEITTESLHISNLNVVKLNGGGEAISKLDDALARVSSIRSKIGAYENRLDYASSSLDQSSEDMTAALSRIEDVDMALEMTNYTKNTVLDQAAISVLSQANELPQTILSLLQ
ncbi:MAG: flagellin [Lachnospiraceae bacterium]|nr:flagellin [Lachnospiraceae bacterium]